MASILQKNIFGIGKFNNYLVAGNICNAFALGELGSTEDFFLVGAEPPDESSFPLLTGNLLDSDGKVLFRLVRNILMINPGHCSKVIGDHIGYEIHDSNGVQILKVATRFEKLPGNLPECYVTTMSVNCFDKSGKLVFKGQSGEEDEHIESSVKSLFGLDQTFGAVQGFTDEELEMARAMLLSGGRIHKVLSGSIQGQDICLDGVALNNAHIDNCNISVSSTDFMFIGKSSSFSNSRFQFIGGASLIKDLVLRMSAS
ncbi:MAG: hypothetical protein H8K03_04275 [Nitrospira sp.]